MPTDTTSKRTFWTILLIAFLDNLSVGILLPLIPLLLTDPGSTLSILPSNYTEAQGYILFGYLLAAYTIAQFIATPILGELSDRHGRRPILAISLTGTCLAYLLFGYAVVTQNLPLLFIARILDGITGGNLSVAQAVIADITEPTNRSKAYGLFGGALGIGFAVGPAIGAFFSNSAIVSWFNPATPFWVTATIVAISVLLVLLFLSETVTAKTKAASLTLTQSIKAISQAFQLPGIRTLFSGIFIWRLGFGFWTTFAAVFLIYRFSLDQTQLGHYFLFVGIWLIISQVILVPWFAKRLASQQVLYSSILFSAIGFLIYLIPNNWHQLLWIIPFLASANALTLANLPTTVSEAAEPATQGRFAGMSNSVQSLALSIAPILSGYISASLNPIMVIATSSILMFVSGIIFLIFARSRKQLANQ